MEIKRPENNVPPQLRDLQQEDKKKSSNDSQASDAASTPDFLEVTKAKAGVDFNAIVAGANQTAENTGQKKLTPEQEKEVAKINFQDDFKKGNAFTGDGRAKFDRGKSSDFTPPFGMNKGSETSPLAGKLHELTPDEKARLSGRSQEQTPDAVKDAEKLLSGERLQDVVKDEVAERQSQFKAFGGSAMDRFLDSLDPSSTPPDGSEVPKGKSAVEDGEVTGGPGYATGYDKSEGVRGGKKSSFDAPGLTRFLTTGGNSDRAQAFRDAEKDFYDKDGAKTITGKDGTVVVKGNDGSTTVTKPDGTVTRVNSDGSTVTTTPDGKKDTTPPLQSYDPENYTGDIPPQLKGFMDFLRNQALAIKPHVGGETELTDGGVTGNQTVGDGPVENLFVQQGVVGLLGQPDRTGEPVSTSGATPAGGSLTSGGAVDFGPDSDQIGYTGPTRTEDPGDVNFGPSGTPVATPKPSDSSGSDSTDSTSDTNIFDNIRDLSNRKLQD